MLALVGGDRGHLGRGLCVVQVLLVPFEGLDEVRYGPCPEQARERHDDPDPYPRPARGWHVRTALAELRRPDLGVPTLVAGDRPERMRSALVRLDRCEGVIEDDCVPFELQIVEALGDLRLGHRHPLVGSVGWEGAIVP